MARKHKPKEIIGKLREAEMVLAQGGTVADHERSGAPTIPQIFLNGEHLSGATDLFDAYNEGRFGDMLAGAGLEITGKEGAQSFH